MTIDTLSTQPTPFSRAVDKRAPMSAAPMIYNDDQSVAWEQMWDSFCVLASAGGPPHRGTLLAVPTDVDANSAGYRTAVAEITRGIRLVSGLAAQASCLSAMTSLC